VGVGSDRASNLFGNSRRGWFAERRYLSASSSKSSLATNPQDGAVATLIVPKANGTSAQCNSFALLEGVDAAVFAAHSENRLATNLFVRSEDWSFSIVDRFFESFCGFDLFSVYQSPTVSLAFLELMAQ
jgi:hypothetical protein